MNKKEIEKEVEYIIAERRHEAEGDAKVKYHKVLKDDEFHELDIAWRKVVLDKATKEVKGVSTDGCDSEIERLFNLRHNCLQKYGFDEKSFKVNYFCKKCNDTGEIGLERCSCYKSLFNEKLFKNSNLSIGQKHFIKDFNENVFDDIHVGEKLKEYCRKYVNNFAEGSVDNLIFVGKTGVGKSFIVEVIANELIERGFVVAYLTAFQFSQQLYKWHLENIDGKEDFQDFFAESDLLIIDDLGTEPLYKNITFEYYQNIVDLRILMNKAIMITTNLDKQEFLNIYGERLTSRLLFADNSKVINIQNRDLRKNK